MSDHTHCLLIIHPEISICPSPGDPCASNPCMNGGMCVSYEGLEFTCRCQQAWTGPTCTQGEFREAGVTDKDRSGCIPTTPPLHGSRRTRPLGIVPGTCSSEDVSRRAEILDYDLGQADLTQKNTLRTGSDAQTCTNAVPSPLNCHGNKRDAESVQRKSSLRFHESDPRKSKRWWWWWWLVRKFDT